MSTTTTQVPFEVIERMDLVPLCPHCEKELPEVYFRYRGFPVGQGRTFIYFCPQCRKTLGFAQGRVF